MPGDSESIEQLIRQVEMVADPALKATVRKLVQLLLDLHASGLERILEIVSSSAGVIDRLVNDETVNSLLLLHDLHPVAFHERVSSALEKLRPYLRSYGAAVDLLGIDDGVIRLRTNGAGHGCVKSAIEDAIYDAAPDLAGLVMQEQGASSGFVPLEALHGR